MRSGELLLFGIFGPDERDFAVISVTSDAMAHPPKQSHSSGFVLLPEP